MKLKQIYLQLKLLKSQLKNSLFLKIKRSDWDTLLKENKKYKDIHKGKRCFILGNGPSLKTDDLKALENEFVFSVNQIARHPDFAYIKPTYHFWADPHFFELDENKPEDRELVEMMKRVKTVENSPICFFPVEQKEVIEKFKVTDELQASYFFTSLHFFDGFDAEIDYTKAVPAFGTVVQWCVTMAIYMGFSEIYLLGCDNTGIVTTIKSALKTNDDSDYGYNITANEKRRLESLLQMSTIEDYLREYTNTFVGYRNLFQYCKKRNIKLVNCSSATVIDSIPRDSLTNVLKKEK